MGCACSVYTVSCEALCSTASYFQLHEFCAFGLSDLGTLTESVLSSPTTIWSWAKLAVGRVRMQTLTDEAGMAQGGGRGAAQKELLSVLLANVKRRRAFSGVVVGQI